MYKTVYKQNVFQERIKFVKQGFTVECVRAHAHISLEMKKRDLSGRGGKSLHY